MCRSSWKGCVAMLPQQSSTVPPQEADSLQRVGATKRWPPNAVQASTNAAEVAAAAAAERWVEEQQRAQKEQELRQREEWRQYNEAVARMTAASKKYCSSKKRLPKAAGNKRQADHANLPLRRSSREKRTRPALDSGTTSSDEEVAKTDEKKAPWEPRVTWLSCDLCGKVSAHLRTQHSCVPPILHQCSR